LPEGSDQKSLQRGIVADGPVEVGELERMETLDSPDVFKNITPTPQPHPPGTARSSAGIRSNVRRHTHARTHAHTHTHTHTCIRAPPRKERERERERDFARALGHFLDMGPLFLSLADQHSSLWGRLLDQTLKPKP
jgi:hypothetical protein